jgi:integrase
MPLSFSLFRRKTAAGSSIYYYRPILKDGSRGGARSTGQKTKAAATRWVLENISSADDSPETRRMRFDNWASDFWSPDGRYVSLRRAHGYSLSPTHVRTMHRTVHIYLLPRFGSMPMDGIRPEQIETFLMELYELGRLLPDGTRRPLAPRTVNGIRGCLRVIFEEAVRLGYVRRSPVTVVHKFKEHRRERGVLSRPELWRLLFAPTALEHAWSNERLAYLFTLTGAITGMRHGELRSLAPSSVHDNYIDIRCGYDRTAKARTAYPKSGHSRIATVPTGISHLLTGWAVEKAIPPDGFLFSTAGGKPISDGYIGRHLAAALTRIDIDRSAQNRRNIVFHSLRHTAVTLLRAEKTDPWQAMQVIGHRTEGMFHHYSNHASVDHLSDVARFQERLLAEKPRLHGEEQ